MSEQTSATTPTTSAADFVHWFRTCAPYIHAFRGKTFVIAFTGELLQSDTFWTFVADINLLASLGVRVVLVHGARPQIDALTQSRGLSIQYHHSRRVTDKDTLAAVVQANGEARAFIEAALSTAVSPAPVANHRLRVVGGNYVMAKPLGIIDGVDMRFTGEVRRVDSDAINDCLATGDVVLLSAFGYSATGEIFNLTLEDIATQAAIALKAHKLIFLTESVGVVNQNGEVQTELYTREAARLGQGAWQSDDIRVFLPCAINACQKGVHRAHLISRLDDGALLSELFTRDGVGTMISIDALDNVRPASIDDVGGIVNIIEPLEEAGVLVARPRALLEQDIEKFFVAVHDGAVVGCAALYPYADERKAEMACLAVLPEYRREGYGEDLLKAIEKASLAQGIKTLFVMTTRTAHWFIERGFVVGKVADLPADKQAHYNQHRMSQVYLKQLNLAKVTP
jgi:amino-acid N-acetyltransferase